MIFPFFPSYGKIIDMDFGVRFWLNGVIQTFRVQFWPTYYLGIVERLHYVVWMDVVLFRNFKINTLATSGRGNWLWLEQDWHKSKRVKTVVVALHIPTFTGAVNRYSRSRCTWRKRSQIGILFYIVFWKAIKHILLSVIPISTIIW